MNIKTELNREIAASPARRIEARANEIFSQSRGQLTPGMYAENPGVKMTKERAFAQALEDDPEAYAAYRDQHNAAPLMAQLQKAGILLARG
jgi:hypothetical protein